MSGSMKVIPLSISAALLAASIIGSGASAQSSKVGTTAEPVTLDLEVGRSTGDWSTELFVRKVEELSGGTLAIIEAGEVDEGAVAPRVQTGEADIGQVFVRGLDQVGGSEFRALLAPFLVTDSVLAEGDRHRTHRRGHARGTRA